MSLPAFDTLKFAKRLREVGVPEPQAEVQVEMLAEAMAERMTTKEDLAKTETALQKEIQELKRDIKEIDARTEIRFKELDAKTEIRFKELDAKVESTKMDIKRDMKELELRMVIKMGAMILAGIGILFGLMRAWPLSVQYVPSPGQEMRYMSPAIPTPHPPAASTGP